MNSFKNIHTHRFLYLFFILLVSRYTSAQVSSEGVVTNSPEAMLDVKSTTKGLLPPRMTTIDRDNIATPAEGLLVYCTDCTPSLWQATPNYTNSLWNGINAPNNPCPKGYRIPNIGEWDAFIASGISTGPLAFNSTLKLSYTGIIRGNTAAELSWQHLEGYYTSTQANGDGTYFRYFINDTQSKTTGKNFSTFGISCRCIKD